jgi:hypothetical protein
MSGKETDHPAHPRFWAGYVLLVLFGATILFMLVQSASDRFYRTYLEGIGVVATGEVIDHRLYRCAGLRCSNKTYFEGAHVSAEFDQFMRDCRGLRNRWKCHTDILTRFKFRGETVEFYGKVDRYDFRRIPRGSSVEVLVNRKEPANSLLLDHDPQGFVFWMALGLAAFVLFVVSMLRPMRNRWRAY